VIDTKTYIALSVVMFLEYAVWGAWAPVLAAAVARAVEDDRQADRLGLRDVADRVHHFAAGGGLGG